jgi:basic membrane lipoprotein Med (substrate-binding protein (PBP1-ABC) superfamily)
MNKMAIALLIVGLVVGAGGVYAAQSAQFSGLQIQVNELAAKNAQLEAQIAALKGTATKELKVFAVFATPIEEPWDNVIHQALLKAEGELGITYDFSDKNGYGPDFEKALRDVASKGYDVIFGDAFGNEEAVRKVASEYRQIQFVFGSGTGPAQPNFSVFDNYLHEPAYLAGIVAGKMTKTNVLGVVAAMPVEEVNRIVNAFISGAKQANPNVKVKVNYIDSWFDPTKAKELALAEIDAGADVLYAERDGVIQAAKERGKLAIGNMLDQASLAPDTVITSTVWDLYGLVKHVIERVKVGIIEAVNLMDYSMMFNGGASLAPFRNFEDKVPADAKAMVADYTQKILSGLFRVPLLEGTPMSD